MTSQDYGFGCTLSGTIGDVRPKVEAALKAHGFGILTEIDVSTTLKKKLDVDIRPYVILGACNPKMAHLALQADPMIGLLLPCNVVLQASQTEGHTDVAVIDPKAMFAIVDEAKMGDIAGQVEALLRAAVESLC